MLASCFCWCWTLVLADRTEPPERIVIDAGQPTVAAFPDVRFMVGKFATEQI